MIKKKITALITHVTDRLGHDRRYAIDCTKIKKELNWKRNFDFETGIENTGDWYLNNKSWIENVCSGEYRKWIKKIILDGKVIFYNKKQVRRL